MGVYKSAFDAKDGTLKKNLVAKDMNAQGVSSNIRAISGTLSHKPVSTQETITESAREAKNVIERVIGERASVVITNDSAQNRAFYNPNEGVIYINNKADLSGEDVAKFVAMHEITHTTEGTKYYDELEEVLVDISKDASAPQALKDKIGDLKERQGEIGRKYEEQLKNQNVLQQIYTVETERNADLIGELLGNDYYINKLADRNLPLLKKLFLKIKGLIKKNADTDSASAKYLNKLASKFAKAIDHSQGGVKISQLGPNEDEENRLEIEPVRFSKEIVPGSDEMFVLVEKASIQKLMSYPGETMQAKVRNYLKQFRGTVLPLGSTNKVYIRREAEGEYTNPAKSVSEIDYEGKLNAASEFENLLQSAKYLEHKEDNGRHPDATRGWNYYELKYVVPTSNGIRAYKGQIQIKLIDRGDCFYDITKIEDITSGSAGQALIKAAGSAYVSSNNSISEKTENVNDFEENNDVRYSKASSEPEFVEAEDGVGVDFGNPLDEINEERHKKVKAENRKRYEYSEQARRESEESLLNSKEGKLEIETRYEGDIVTDEERLTMSEAQVKQRLEALTARDKFAGNKNKVLKMESVFAVTGEEFAKGELDLVTQVDEYFKTFNYRVYNKEVGKVLIDKRGIKDDIAHGIGRKKAATFAAVPDVIKNGKVVDYQKNWKGRGYDTAAIAAPIIIANEKHYMGVVVIRNKENNRFYVHEVATIKEEGAQPFKTSLAENNSNAGGDTPSIISILQNLAKNNPSYEKNSIYTKKGAVRSLVLQAIDSLFNDGKSDDVAFILNDVKNDIVSFSK